MELKECLLLSFLLFFMAAMSSEATLSPDYYSKTCPNVESIVLQSVRRKLFQTFVTAPATLRLFFHDCMVTGADASVMIYSPKGDAEKDASDNLSLAGDGFDTVVKAKAAVESKCPGVVSCADILALAARDVVALTGGPNFTVELGRLDGYVSSSSLVAGRLPAPEFNLNKLLRLFRRNNMTVVDLVALSGAHTIGFSHCSRFRDRLYVKGTCTVRVDPTLNKAFASRLMQACPCNVDPNIAVDMDPYTAAVFDNKYFKNLQNLEGLFTSDEVLYVDGRSRPYVNQYAANQSTFFRDFAMAMQKVGRLGVKSGKQGNVRLDCTKFH